MEPADVRSLQRAMIPMRPRRIRVLARRRRQRCRWKTSLRHVPLAAL